MWTIWAKEWAWFFGILIAVPVSLITESGWVTAITGFTVVGILKLARRLCSKLGELLRKVEAKRAARLIVRRGDPDWVEPRSHIEPKRPIPAELRKKN